MKSQLFEGIFNFSSTFSKINKILVLLVTIFSAFTFNSCNSDFDDNTVSASELISKDSEFYQMLKKVTTEGDTPMESVTCIDFIYPFTLVVYDEMLRPISTEPLYGDEQFSLFLDNLPSNRRISISYPISTTLSDGTTFSVNNNEELKLAIDSCSKEDIISYGNNLFSDSEGTICIWRIPFRLDAQNKYVSALFLANFDGSLTFKYNGETYLGTWVFLFIEDKLHMNVHLLDDSEVGLDWNFNLPIEFLGNKIKIIAPSGDIILQQYCETSDEYEIGDEGPEGGIVFYDKGSYSDGWRYLEASTTDLEISEWGCYGSLLSSTTSEIGGGYLNSAKIVNFHNGLENFYTNPSNCNAESNGTVIAKIALEHEIDSSKDWFLPNKEELLLMYNNLHTDGLGNFASSWYWTSNEVDDFKANTVNFSTGTIEETEKNAPEIKARAIRFF